MVQQKPTNVLEVFRDSVLQIPEYQRDYSWKEKHVRDLLRDIDYMRHEEQRDGNDFHYFGTIVLHKKEEIPVGGDTYEKYDIVDGQQRMTTISLLMGSVIEQMEAMSINPDELDQSELRPDRQATDLEEDYIEKRGKQRLSLHGRDQETFDSLVYNQQNPYQLTGNTASERNLIAAKVEILDWLEDLHPGSEIEYYRILLDIIRIINSSFEVTEYKVDGIGEAGRIFETLNDRGRNLSTVDKIKSYLVYVAYRIDEEALAERIYREFGKVIRNITQNGDEKELNRFIKEHWRMFSGETQFSRGSEYDINDLHRRIKSVEDHVPLDRNKPEIVDWIEKYLSSISESSVAHNLVMHPGDIDTNEHEGPVDEAIRNLKSIHRHTGGRNVNALLMALYLQFGFSEEFNTVTTQMERFAWRTFQVCRANSNVRRTKFREISYSLYYAGDPSGPASIFATRDAQDIDVYDSLESGFKSVCHEIENAVGNYGAERSFIKNLRRHDIYDGDLNEDGWNGFRNKSKIRYFLYEYERYIRGNHSLPQVPELEVWEGDDGIQIEHIWPQSGNSVPDNKKSEHKEYVDCLGNLALLHPDDNKSLSDKPYARKHREVYANSPMEMLKELPDPSNTDWAESTIEARLDDLVDFARDRWDIDTGAYVLVESMSMDELDSDDVESIISSQIEDAFTSSKSGIPTELNNLPKVEFVDSSLPSNPAEEQGCPNCGEKAIEVVESEGEIQLNCTCGTELDTPTYVIYVRNYELS